MLVMPIKNFSKGLVFEFIQYESIFDEVGMKHKSLLAFYKFSVTEKQ